MGKLTGMGFVVKVKAKRNHKCSLGSVIDRRDYVFTQGKDAFLLNGKGTNKITNEDDYLKLTHPDIDVIMVIP